MTIKKENKKLLNRTIFSKIVNNWTKMANFQKSKKCKNSWKRIAFSNKATKILRKVNHKLQYKRTNSIRSQRHHYWAWTRNTNKNKKWTKVEIKNMIKVKMMKYFHNIIIKRSNWQRNLFEFYIKLNYFL